MTQKQVIPNALDLAEKVAETILRDSYKDGRDESIVKDVLLFGSTLLSGEAHDIDMLAIHNSYPLNEFVFATIYDEKIGRTIPHPTANIQEGFYRPTRILKAMGGEGIYNLLEMRFEIEAVERRQMSEMRVLGDHYLGTLDLPYVGEIKFLKPVPYETVFDAVKSAINEKLVNKMVVTKVKALMEECELDVDKALDLHVMSRDLLSAKEMQNEREIVIAQCKNPTFWNTILTTGRLYNLDSGKFEIPLYQKYKGGSQLFPN